MSTPEAIHHARVLRALGLVDWRCRGGGKGYGAAALQTDDGHHACVVLLPAKCSTRELDLLGRALTSTGALLARAARVRVGANGQVEAPTAANYLACGTAQAQALGRSLPAQSTAQAQILLVDEPDRLLHDGAAKRRLWIALRTLRRHLVAGDR